MRRFLIFILLCALPTTAYAQQPITAKDALHTGDTVVVEDSVAQVFITTDSASYYITFGNWFPNQTLLALVPAQEGSPMSVCGQVLGFGLLGWCGSDSTLLTSFVRTPPKSNSCRRHALRTLSRQRLPSLPQRGPVAKSAGPEKPAGTAVYRGARLVERGLDARATARRI